MALDFKGQYAECKVFTDVVEVEAVKQIYGFLNHPAFEGLKIRIQSDVHAGAGAVIGFTSTLGSKIIPNVIGVDIGCSVCSYNLGKIELDFADVDRIIRTHVPSGFEVRQAKVQKYLADKIGLEDLLLRLDMVCKTTDQDYDRVVRSIGTLGGGNHFIEIGQDENGDKWLTIHTGSRNFGLKVAQYHQAIANKANPFGALSFLEGNLAEDYFHDMKVAQDYAAANRRAIGESILLHLRIKAEDYVESVHNYIDFKNGFIRKGAISAQNGEKVIIPWNMRDGLIIGVGKGNPDYNYSAPHGAGRVMGRGFAKKNLDIEEFRKSMNGIWTSCVSENTIDEAPMAYKDHEEVEKYLHETVEVIHRVKPLYNFKASE